MAIAVSSSGLRCDRRRALVQDGPSEREVWRGRACLTSPDGR